MRSVGPFHTALSALPSSLGICHRSAVCPPLPAGDRCMTGWSDQCAQTNVCCTVKKKQEHQIEVILYKHDTISYSVSELICTFSKTGWDDFQEGQLYLIFL